MGSSFLELNVQSGGFFQIFWKIFQDKGKNHQRLFRCLEVAKWVVNY